MYWCSIPQAPREKDFGLLDNEKFLIQRWVIFIWPNLVRDKIWETRSVGLQFSRYTYLIVVVVGALITVGKLIYIYKGLWLTPEIREQFHINVSLTSLNVTNLAADCLSAFQHLIPGSVPNRTNNIYILTTYFKFLFSA